jgi:hypothetical protein
MVLTITKAQRDALYDQILDRLSGIGDIEVAIEAGNYTAAKRLSREYSDDLRLLVDDLGFGERDDEPVELTTSPEVLCRVLPRMRELATGYTASQESERAEARELEERNRLVAEACQRVLSDLGATETGSQWTISKLPSLLPRFPRAFRRDNPESVDAAAGIRMWQGPSARASAPRGNPQHAEAAGGLRAQDERLVINRLLLSGILVAEPAEEKGCDGMPITLLLIVFADPESGEAGGRLMCEIEVPDDVAGQYGKKLRAGDSVFITGQLSGSGGGIVATEILPGPPNRPG